MTKRKKSLLQPILQWNASTWKEMQLLAITQASLIKQICWVLTRKKHPLTQKRILESFEYENVMELKNYQ